MLTVLWLAVTGFLVSLLIWSTVFLLAAIASGVVLSRWCSRRMRRVPDGPLWLLRVWIVAMVFLAPAGIAMFQAVPFVVTRELALLVQRSAPEATTWMTELAAGQVADLLEVASDDTMVDLSDLKDRAEAAVADLVASRPGMSTLAWIRNLAAEKSLRAILAGLDQLSPADGRMRWSDIVTHTRTLTTMGSNAVTKELVSNLHLAAWAQAAQAVVFIAICHGLTMALFALVLRPSQPSAPPLDPSQSGNSASASISTR